MEGLKVLNLKFQEEKNMNNKIGIAAIIFGIAALVTAIGTAVVNFMTFKWAVRVYEPLERVVKKSEPMMDKLIVYSDKALDNYLAELDED